ncbi:hypothetical protein B1A87_006980 [Arthrobacter sp. KBS0703]|uniref:hypothetical protein n=1 Tax=Arthrobacter sp. KBS0703 TaxID=1955698 RepID=UPI00098F90A7|nr:hypothetical protein [Arthrobacter sp. KBS0703]TSE15682.1 hypothetical protein B1A87_006980 [Arthrobacter sp. KBS0703]
MPCRCRGFLHGSFDLGGSSSCRDFFLAGWTVADILPALDWMPDGTQWPHSGAPDTKDPRRMRDWLRHRLSHWRTEAGDHAFMIHCLERAPRT